MASKMGFLGLFGSGKAKSEGKDYKQASLLPFTGIEGRVIAAFSKVKQDITLLSSWLKYLRHKDLLNEQRHAKTQRELGEHKVHISNLKAEASEMKAAIQHLREELKEVKITSAKAGKAQESSPLTDLIRTKSELNPDRKRTYFENKVVSMLRSRRKDYVLKQILELAEKEAHSTREIEEIIVGEKALCGRTAFYDYFKELKHKKLVRQSEKGAKKVIGAEKGPFEEVR